MEEKTSWPFCELGWLVHYLGVIFTPSELPTSGTISSTGGRPCRSLRRGLNAGASPPTPPLRSQWRYSRPAVRTRGWGYEPIIADPEMGRLAWCVTHLQMVSLLLGSSFRTT